MYQIVSGSGRLSRWVCGLDLKSREVTRPKVRSEVGSKRVMMLWGGGDSQSGVEAFHDVSQVSYMYLSGEGFSRS